MPLVGPNTYLPTAREFLNHWEQVEATASVTITLQGGYSRTDFLADIEALDTQIKNLNEAQNTFRAEIVGRDSHKSQLNPLLKRYRAAISASFPGTEWTTTLPKVPNAASTPAKFLDPFRDMRDHWARLNGLPAGTIPGYTAPFVLPIAGTTLAAYTAQLAQMESAFIKVGTAESVVDSTRAGRDALLPGLKERMKQYGNALKATLGTSHPSVKNAPRLTPTRATALPPLNATIQWEGAQKRAVIAFNRLPDSAKVVRYELRYYPGPRYIARNEQTIGQVGGSASTISTDTGLQFPGAIASYRLYAVTDSGRETGSPSLVMMVPDEE